MLHKALNSSDPYWIGIASHAYADTWAHQNFTGMKDPYNCVHAYYVNNTTKAQDNTRKIGRYGINHILSQGNIPHTGHLDVLNLPDIVNGTWYDYRLKRIQVKNNKRFIAAAKNLFLMYVKHANVKLAPQKPRDVNKRWTKPQHYY